MKHSLKGLRNVLIVLFLFMVSLSFSFTTNYADWYGLTFLQPSPSMIAFSEKAGGDIDLLKTSSFVYTFESNVNPRQSSMVTNGFTFSFTIADHLPFSDFRYGMISATYDLWAKLIGFRLGNQTKENIIGFGGSIGLGLENTELLVGTSNFADDFNLTDFKHYNSVYNLGLMGLISLFFEIPVNNKNFPSVMYNFSYGVGMTVYGPFLPNLESVQDFEDVERVYNIMNHTLTVRVKF